MNKPENTANYNGNFHVTSPLNPPRNIYAPYFDGSIGIDESKNAKLIPRQSAKE